MSKKLPTYTEMIVIIRKAYNTHKLIFMNRCEIYKVRKEVIDNLLISEDSFNDFLVLLWRNGRVRLEMGAPIYSISRNRSDYLITSTGTHFYYMEMH